MKKIFDGIEKHVAQAVSHYLHTRKPTEEQRKLSKIDKKDFSRWFQQIWNITGASTRNHPAPFPLELASRKDF